MRSRGSECRLTAGFPVSAVSAVCFEGCRLSRSVSTPSVQVSTCAGGDFVGFGSRRPPFRHAVCLFDPPCEGLSSLWGCFRPSLIRFRPSFRLGFRLSRVVSTPSVPLPTLLLMVSTLSDPLTGFRPSFPRGITCLTLPLFQPLISVVCSMSQTPFYISGVSYLFHSNQPLWCLYTSPPRYKKAGRG